MDQWTTSTRNLASSSLILRPSSPHLQCLVACSVWKYWQKLEVVKAWEQGYIHTAVWSCWASFEMDSQCAFQWGRLESRAEQNVKKLLTPAVAPPHAQIIFSLKNNINISCMSLHKDSEEGFSTIITLAVRVSWSEEQQQFKFNNFQQRLVPGSK